MPVRNIKLNNKIAYIKSIYSYPVSKNLNDPNIALLSNSAFAKILMPGHLPIYSLK